MQWGEVDLDGATWTIPSSKAKNTITHRVPLADTAVELLKAIRPTPPPKPDAFVFAGISRHPDARTAKRFPPRQVSPDIHVYANDICVRLSPEAWPVSRRI